jgi:SAM-dependent methyltransferase
MSTKAIQGKLWSVEPHYWAQHFEPWFLPMYAKVLEQLELSEEDSLLDAGCGSGFFSSMAIEKGADVVGVDASTGLLRVARRRNPKNNFLEEDLEVLPFKDGSFDVVTGFNSFQYAGSFEKALAEAKRVVKPGGRLVLGIWDKPEMSDASSVLKVIGSLMGPPQPGTPDPFALSEDGRIEGSFLNNGLTMVYKARVSCPFLYSSLGDGIKSFMGTGPAAAAVNNSGKQIVEESIAKALQRYRMTDGFYFLQNHFLIFIGKKI